MTQVSKIPIRKEIEKRMYDVFLDSISMVRAKHDVEKLIDDLLSPTEKTMLAKRLSIALLLLKQYDQRLISKLLRVGLGTVSKVNRNLQNGRGGYFMVTSAIIKQEKYESFISKIDDLIADLFPPRHRNWTNWRKQRFEEKIQKSKPF